MRFGPRLALLCLLVLAAAVPVVAVGQSAAGPGAIGVDDGAPAPAVAQAENETVSPESMTLDVQLLRNGDARWTVSTTFVLRNDSDRRAFQRLADSFVTGDADGASYDVATFERASEAAQSATGRQMRIEQPQYNASTNETGNVTIGRLTLTFQWTNFTETSGERLIVGDAFNSTTGTWLPGLTSGQTLVVRPPPGYAVLTSPPNVGVQNGVLRWEGPTSFDAGYFEQITYRQTGPGSTPDSSPRETPSPGGFDLSALGLVGVVVIGLGALAIGAYVVSRRGEDDDTAAPAATSERNANGGVDEPSGAGSTEATAGAAGAAAAGDDDSAEDTTPEPDFELLSDEERVEYLLEQNGGRMKQATIVKETGWSNAKVSQLLSSMDDEDRIDKLRIGRENLISLPDEDVGAFDDE
jgi:uncharacterized membrane protein